MNLKTSILLETTEDGQWAAFISHGPLSTGRVFPDLKTACYESRARVKEFQMADKFAAKLDGMPEIIDLAEQEKTSTELGTETYVLGPGFGVQERLSGEALPNTKTENTQHE